MVEPQLVRDFVATGQVLFEYRDFAFLAQESVLAAEAALCANDQGLFWEMHDALFYNQVNGSRGAFVRARLNHIAETVGDLDTNQWSRCMDDRTHRSAVEAEKADGDRLGVSGTPSFLVNGQLVFGASYEELTQLIQTELARQ